MPQETHVNVGGTWEEARTVYTRVGGAWRRVTEVHTRVAGVWKQVFVGLSASKDGDASAGVGVFDTNNVTITPLEGVSPYTYAWSRASGDLFQTISDASGQIVFWSNTETPPVSSTSTWDCVVTDSHGSQVTVNVTVDFINL